MTESSNIISPYPAWVCSRTNCRKDHWVHTGSLIMPSWQQKSDFDITSSIKESLCWITGLCKRELQIITTYWFCQRTLQHEWVWTRHCALYEFSNVSTNEKWLKGRCSGIWQVSKNSLLIKPVTPEANLSSDSVLWNVWAQHWENRQGARQGKTWLVYIRNWLMLSRKAFIEELLVGM